MVCPAMKTILLGASNPYPGEALYPSPPGCAGWRLWQMSGMDLRTYLRKFDRRNLFTQPDLEVLERTSLGRAFLANLAPPTEAVVVLGDDVRSALGLPKRLIHPIVKDGIAFRQIPHPSGRCLFYNEPIHRDLVRLLLEEMP